MEPKNAWVNVVEKMALKDVMYELKNVYKAEDETSAIKCLYGGIASNLAILSCNCDGDAFNNGTAIKACRGAKEAEASSTKAIPGIPSSMGNSKTVNFGMAAQTANTTNTTTKATGTVSLTPTRKNATNTTNLLFATNLLVRNLLFAPAYEEGGLQLRVLAAKASTNGPQPLDMVLSVLSTGPADPAQAKQALLDFAEELDKIVNSPKSTTEDMEQYKEVNMLLELLSNVLSWGWIGAIPYTHFRGKIVIPGSANG